MTYLAPAAARHPADLENDLPHPDALLRPAVLATALVVTVGAVLAWPTLSAELIAVPKVHRVLDKISASLPLRAAVIVQNETLAGQSQAEIDAYDEAWMAERRQGTGPLIQGHLALPASDLLRHILAESGGVVEQAILMDNRGRNVAIALPTSDFWQGDEDKWRMTYLRGPAGEHRAVPEQGHDGRFVACWVSRTVNDARTGQPIGAVAIEVNALKAGTRFCGTP
jgi:hypothetical protein